MKLVGITIASMLLVACMLLLGGCGGQTNAHYVTFVIINHTGQDLSEVSVDGTGFPGSIGNLVTAGTASLSQPTSWPPASTVTVSFTNGQKAAVHTTTWDPSKMNLDTDDIVILIHDADPAVEILPYDKSQTMRDLKPRPPVAP